MRLTVDSHSSLKRLSLILIWGLSLGIACQQDKIQVYRIAKEHAPNLFWQVPPSWQKQPASGMRLASFRIPGHKSSSADMSVVVLAGDAGGILANVNRWRGQIGLKPMDDAALKKSVRRMPSPAGELWLVEFANDTGIVAAILPTREKTWFFKMSGPRHVVAEARASFLAFLRSLRPTG